MNEFLINLLHFVSFWLFINIVFSRKINPDGSKVWAWNIHKDINEPGFRWFNK